MTSISRALLNPQLATSDKDFTGRERLGGTSGAYADTHGRFEGNTTGPSGNTALTGREGNPAHNPVAQAKSHGDVSGTGVTTQAGETATNEHGEPHKKGVVDKIKDVLT
jgi:hypothetical protein